MSNLSHPLFAKLETPAGVPPGIAVEFEKVALEVAGRGFRKYSARAIAHRLRWHHQIERNDRTYKINNHWTPVLARWFGQRHPRLASLFELRERRDGGGDE